jgi:hypothetical protein
MIARTPLLLATTALLLGCPQLQEHCGKYNPLFCVMELETVTETAGDNRHDGRADDVGDDGNDGPIRDLDERHADHDDAGAGMQQ